jgi:hypothetical protein
MNDRSQGNNGERRYSEGRKRGRGIMKQVTGQLKSMEKQVTGK